MSKGIAVVAVGGNALIRDSAHTALSDQYDAVCATAAHVVDMVAAGWNVVVTHGNGPQVGFILRRSEIAEGQVPTVPIRYAVGDTQGAIGFMFQNALGNALKRRGIEMPVVALVTQTLVDKRDPAFAHPDKPVGSFMSEETARRFERELGWSIMQDGDRGWRRCVASPQPLQIIESLRRGEEFVLRVLVEQVVDDLHRIDLAGFERPQYVGRLPAIDADAEALDLALRLEILGRALPALGGRPRDRVRGLRRAVVPHDDRPRLCVRHVLPPISSSPVLAAHLSHPPSWPGHEADRGEGPRQRPDANASACP